MAHEEELKLKDSLIDNYLKQLEELEQEIKFYQAFIGKVYIADPALFERIYDYQGPEFQKNFIHNFEYEQFINGCRRPQ